MAWTTSTRRARLPRDWAKRVAATKLRANGLCEAQPHAQGCDGIGSQCDHVQRGDDHALTNLQWLSRPCHTAKTQAEAQAVRKENKRSVRVHPGLLPPPGA